MIQPLRFANPADQRQVFALDAFVRARTSPLRRHWPYRLLGNFIQANWQSDEECYLGTPGCRRFELATLAYDVPDAFGVVFMASHTPKDGGWTARLMWRARGSTVVGEGYSLRLARFDSTRIPRIPRFPRCPA